MDVHTPSKTREIIENENLLGHIIKVDFQKGFPGDNDVQGFIERQKKVQLDEVEYTAQGVLGGFIPNIISTFILEGTTEEGKKIPFQTKIWSKTMDNLLEEDIIENIRKNGTLDILNIYFEFGMSGGNEYSEYHFGDEKFFQHAQKKVIEFIKSNPEMERVIVNHYCDLLSTTLGVATFRIKILQQMEDTQKKISEIVKFFTQLGKEPELLQDKEFEELLNQRDNLNHKYGGFWALEIKLYLDHIVNCGNDIYINILKPIEEGKRSILMDSKYFYLDNGDDLYDKVTEESIYRKYYQAELDLLKTHQERIGQYIRSNYIGLGCGNGKKDLTLLLAAEKHYEKTRQGYGEGGYIDQQFIANQHALLIDSSLKSIYKAKKLLDKKLPIICNDFSLEWIDKLIDKGYLKTNISNSPYGLQASLFQSSIEKKQFQNMKKTITLLGGTFGNFGSYQPTFLQQMYELMQSGDILIISAFNKVKNTQEKKETEDIYDTDKYHDFVANFFQKLGIPKENIQFQVKYDTNDIIYINAKIAWGNTIPIIARVAGKKVEIPDGTVFECIQSERFDTSKFKKIIEESKTDLKIRDVITKEGNPFTLYILEKEPKII